MKRSKTRPRPKISKALRELRLQMGHTQESFSRLMGVSLQTITLWELRRPPAGIVLYRLANMAEEQGLDELMGAFLEAAHADPMSTAERYDIDEETARWHDIKETVIQVGTKGKILQAQGHPLGKEIEDLVMKLLDLCKAANDWSWRNQR
jgi:transcriptional regulator with XRE-family HTH domain